MGKAWPALDIYVPRCDPQLQELVLADLDDFQPTAIHEIDESSRLRVFFTTSGLRDAAAYKLATEFGIHLIVEAIEVEDEDWAARSQAQLRAVTVGRVVVAPPWDVPVQGSDPLTKIDRGSDPMTRIVIRPSMGFGTGHHATTRLMLKAVQSIALRERTVLDIGCGSGVLAIAAVCLGARRAVGVDTDPDALNAAAENLQLNGVADRVRLEQQDFRQMSAPFQVVMANLSGGLLERSAGSLGQLVETHGDLIVSGFMRADTNVLPSLEKFFAVTTIDEEEEWTCAILRRPAL